MWADSSTPRPLSVERGPKPVWLRNGGQVVRDPIEPAREVARRAANVPPELAAVPRHGALDLVAGPAQLALELSASALDPALEAVAGGVPAALELAQARRDPALQPLDLTLSGRAAGVRLDRLHDVVAGGQRGADRNQDGTLGLLDDCLEARGLGLRTLVGRAGRRTHGAARGRTGAAGACAGAPATPGSGSLPGAGAALRRGAGRTSGVRLGSHLYFASSPLLV